MGLRLFFKEILNAPKETDKVSSSYLWFHLGNLCASVVFLRVGMTIAAQPDPNVEGLSLLLVTYLGLITGNKLAGKILHYKIMVNRMHAGATTTKTETSTSTVVTPVAATVATNTIKEEQPK